MKLQISSLEIIARDIGKIIKVLKMNKAHGNHKTSIMMLKLTAITEPLYLIFENCLNPNTVPDVWKKVNVISVFKKGDKQVI